MFLFRNGVDKRREYLLKNKRKESILVNYNIYAPKPIAYTNSGVIVLQKFTTSATPPSSSAAHEPNPLS